MCLFLIEEYKMGGLGRGRGGGGRGGRGGISWIKKDEPKFIIDFKERIAYKEQANLETKVCLSWTICLFSTRFFIFLFLHLEKEH